MKNAFLDLWPSLFLVFLSLGLLVHDASAAEWYPQCDTTLAPVSRLNPGMTACVVPSGLTDSSKIISVPDCENLDATFFADWNGDGTGATGLTATLESCGLSERDATTAGLDTELERDRHCVDFAGGAILGGGNWQGAGAPANFLRFKFSGTFAGDPRISLRCNR